MAAPTTTTAPTTGHRSAGHARWHDLGSPERRESGNGQPLLLQATDGALLQLVTSPPAPRREVPDDDDWFLGVAMDAVGEVRLLRRRELLMGAGAAVFGATATPGSLTSNAGDEATVDSYLEMLAQLRSQGRCQPASLVLPSVMVHLSALSALAGACGGAARARVLAAGARYAEYAGWLYQECGDDRGWRGARTGAEAEELAAASRPGAGDRDQACRSARTGLAGAVRVDSATVRQDIRHLARLIGRWRSDPQVQDLAVDLTQALRTPVPGPHPSTPPLR